MFGVVIAVLLLGLCLVVCVLVLLGAAREILASFLEWRDTPNNEDA